MTTKPMLDPLRMTRQEVVAAALLSRTDLSSAQEDLFAGRLEKAIQAQIPDATEAQQHILAFQLAQQLGILNPRRVDIRLRQFHARRKASGATDADDDVTDGAEPEISRGIKDSER